MPLIKTDYEKDYHNSLFYREIENSQRNHARLRLTREYSNHGPDCEGHPLLEIGCGQGGFLRVAEQCFVVEGVDISSQAIEAIRSHFAERVRVADIQTHGLPRQRYAVVAAFNILEHLHSPAAALHTIAGALRPGGLLIGTVPHNAYPLGRLVTRIGNFVDRTHVSTLPPRAWAGLIEQAGFARCQFFGEVPFGRNRARFLRGRGWPWLALNLGFACWV